ncbi:PRKR-interacting protein 1 homolog [Varroa jacobsoni]|uniref:PRKR-interacting protein 1 n=1 Tax=Varroa destructor TaxID=109461 RepID=A0A7M7MAN6_VARDE|nr:PRKR-interacting protein 1 homolog [Varroa destructor]XP_022648200.1 PRKR-interacting protein 1 homolog [Varroa destructor]XP_022696241.1 PRKR-interacting protein 1 homolog [Varroa jacobsoni]XP_022696242.1 PRKR-interacting protein 1 homolog [Varroa jacobsoni]
MADSGDLDLLGLPKPKAKKEREKQEVVVVRTARDAQRLQLDRLMRHPEKEVHIPERRQENRGHKVPEFVRNVMGSSAGAGSGEFHVYRQLRKKEITRVKLMEELAEKERLDNEFAARLAAKEKAAEEKTARKRAKRNKKKQKLKDNRNKAKKSKAEAGADNEPTPESEDEASGEDETQEKISETNDAQVMSRRANTDGESKSSEKNS